MNPYEPPPTEYIAGDEYSHFERLNCPVCGERQGQWSLLRLRHRCKECGNGLGIVCPKKLSIPMVLVLSFVVLFGYLWIRFTYETNRISTNFAGVGLAIFFGVIPLIAFGILMLMHVKLGHAVLRGRWSVPASRHELESRASAYRERNQA